jgi:acetyl-CoA carboxylase biotin carboxyl carrier protein
MDIKQIQELVKLINKSNIGELTIEEEGVKITIKQKKDAVQTVVAAQAAPVYAAAAPVAAAAPAAPAAEAKVAAPDPKIVYITSPLVGTFYSSSKPGMPPFVHVGSKVVPGTVVGIIEAMKILNNIESEYTGTIEEILVQNETPVGYDQKLFAVRLD